MLRERRGGCGQSSPNRACWQPIGPVCPPPCTRQPACAWGPVVCHGAPGPTGPMGPAGPAGITGATGISPTISVAGTTTGSPGTQASVDVTFTPLGAELLFTIPAGPTGPAGPAGPARALAGMQAQLDNGMRALLEDRQAVLFNKLLNQSDMAIEYRGDTGEFILPAGQTYLITWWVTVDGTETLANVAFALTVGGGIYSTAFSPLVTCQLSGSALLTVGDAPQALALANVSGDRVRLAGTPVQANLVIATLSA